ncbi:MAG: thioredoxin domain-containing protein [Anaerolineales bacterium]|nr:thioredoxin domain-containing protein [Anaerolineales bacterium]
MAKKTTRKKQQKQQQQLMIIVGAAAVSIILVAAAIFLVQSQANTEVCQYDDEECYGTYLGLESGLTEEGIPYIGSLESQVVFTEFADFSCPHCAEFHSTADRLIEDLVRTGQARFEYRTMSGLQPPYSETSARAALCAAEQDAFWQFQAELFELQEAETPRAFTQDKLVDMAGEMGLDGNELKSCMNSNRPRAGITATQNLASRNGVTGTPTILYSYDGGETWARAASSYSEIRSAVLAAQP